jgi:hypothetical protein
VVDGLNGGYAFSVRINGNPAVSGFFMRTIQGFVYFPTKLILTELKKRQMQKSLRKQVAQIVTSDDPRYRRNKPKPTIVNLVAPRKNRPPGTLAYCPDCDHRVRQPDWNDDMMQCDGCHRKFNANGPEYNDIVWKLPEVTT